LIGTVDDSEFNRIVDEVREGVCEGVEDGVKKGSVAGFAVGVQEYLGMPGFEGWKPKKLSQVVEELCREETAETVKEECKS